MFAKIFNKNKVINDEKIIDEILKRSISAVYPNKEELKKKLLSGERLRIYTGADATGSQLHLGHATNFIVLEKFRKLGHEIIVLFGDFTAKIGDPTDKNSARIPLTDKEVKRNLETWKSQVEKIINFKDKNNPVKIVYNNDWLSKLSFKEVVDLASNFTVQQMIERDMFKKRIQEGKPIYLHEFFYPLMQGYDSVYLNVDLEIGGNDQTFNMLAGRTLLSKIKNKNKFVIATTLLENPVTGKKLMSKSVGGSYIAINDEPNNMFGKVMALPDETIFSMFVDCTSVELDDIEKIKSDLLTLKINPKEAKMKLAGEIVKMFWDEKSAVSAKNNFESVFSGGAAPENIEEVFVNGGTKLVDVLLDKKLIASRGEMQRLVGEGAIKNLDGDTKIDNRDFAIQKTMTLKIGKKRFIKVVVKG